MAILSFQEARERVLEEVRARWQPPATEQVALAEAAGRVLAEPVFADRDYPPFDRSVRDGFAIRAAELPGELRLTGEVRAGQHFTGTVETGCAVEIMTGAPVPAGADAVVMVEHVERGGGRIRIGRRAEAGDFISPRGCEAVAGSLLLGAGRRLNVAQIGVLASTGHETVTVYRKPVVAILTTGDELVGVDARPEPHQIRNSNAYTLAAQVRRAGGSPQILGVAPDRVDETYGLVQRGLDADLLLLSGGVSAGRYDVVEEALQQVGAEFFFDRVAIQPGQPLVFGRARERFFFGLPGNPVSTMVTFEMFARAALELLAGQAHVTLGLAQARLTRPFRHKAGLTRFLPALLEDGKLTPMPWQGSGDLAAVARANAFMVVDAVRETWAEGDFLPVYLNGEGS